MINQISTQEPIGDNPKDVETTKENPNDIPKRDIDPNIDEVVPPDDTIKEIKDKIKSRMPNNHLISNVMGNVNEKVVTRRQSRMNEMIFVCYASQLEPKNVEKP